MSRHLEIRQRQAALGTHNRGMPLLAPSSVLVLSLATAQPLAAQTVNVTTPGSLTAATGTTTPASGAVWNLLSTGIFLDTTVTLPAGPPGLTINGNGNTLMLNNGGVAPFGRFVSSTAVTTGLSNITISGASISPTSGGVIFTSSGGLALDTTGAVAFTNNNAFSGGAIDVNGPLSIGNATSTIAFTGNNADNVGGAIVTAGSTTAITINGSEIVVSDNHAGGSSGGAIFSQEGDVSIGNANSTVTLSGNSVAVAAGGAIYAGFSAATINGSQITVTNNASGGSGGAIDAFTSVSIGNTNSTVTLTGNSAAGGFGGAISSGGPATINGSAITISNNSASIYGGAIHANGDVSIGNAGSIVTVTGNSAQGMGNSTGGQGGAIRTFGSATITGSAITMTGNSVAPSPFNSAMGGFGGAIYALSNITITASASSSISNNTATSADGGALWSGGTVTVNASEGDFSFTGNRAGGLGGAIYGGSNVTLNATGGDINFSGNMEGPAGATHANAIYLNNTGGSTTTTFNAAAGNTITFFDPIQSNAANGLVTVTKTGAGTVAFDGSLYTNSLDQLSQVYANTTVQEGSFVVDNNAVYGALAANVSQTAPSSFTVDSGAMLAGGIAGTVRADNFALNGTLDISGSTVLGHPAGTAAGGFSTFNVISNNVSFGAGSQVLFNTYLNDASTQLTDLLNLNLNGSATSGTASIFVTNVGGPGGQTTGNGIELVQVIGGNGTTAGAFTLGNPELRGGAYDYRLFQGPLVPCASPTTREPMVPQCENWFLRSTFVVPPGPPEPPPEPPFPPTPPAPGPGTFPIIGPELATYGVVQPMAQQLGRTMLGTHDDRLGDLYPMPCEPTAPIYTKAPVYTKAPTDCADGFRPAVWGRLFGQQIDNHYQAYADPRTDGQIAGMQVGFDAVRSDSLIPGHKDYGGLYFAYGNANVDVSGLVTNAAATAYVLQHTGALNLNAYSGGAYWTHYGAPGWYVDLVLQGTSYNGGASTEFAALKTTGSGFISSLEGGYPIALPLLGPGFVLEPQAQVLWQWIGFDAGNDGLGPVALGTTSETTARVGLKGKWTVTTDSGQVWQPYVRTNVWSDFGGTAVTMFGPDSVPLISHGQYMDVDAGFTTKINAHLSAFAEAGYQFAISNDGGGKRDGVKGTAGLRYQW